MTTYTIAFWNDCLVASIPDGADLDKAIREEAERSRCFEMEATHVEEGLILTDDPQDDDEIIYSGTDKGWLCDENGKTYEYAVRR